MYRQYNKDRFRQPEVIPTLDTTNWAEKAYPVPNQPILLKRSHYLNLAGRADGNRKSIGDAIYEDGCVSAETISDYDAYLLVDDVELDDVFRVHVWTDKQSFYFSCTCPMGIAEPKSLCEHKYAAHTHLRHTLFPGWYGGGRSLGWRVMIDGLLEGESKPQKTTTAKQVLIFSLQHDYRGWGIVPYGAPTSCFPGADFGDPASIRASAVASLVSKEYKQITGKFNPARYVNITEPLSWLAQASLLGEKLRRESTVSIDAAIRSLADQPFFAGRDGYPVKTLVHIDDEPGYGIVEIVRDRRALRVTTSVIHRGESIALMDETASVVCNAPMWVLAGNKLISVPDGSDTLASWAGRAVRVPSQEQERFLTEYLPRVVDRYQIKSELLECTDIAADCVGRLYLSEVNGELVVDVRFAYGEYELPADKSPAAAVVRQGPRPEDNRPIPLFRIFRHIDREAELYAQLPSLGLKRGPSYDKLLLKARFSPIDFLLHQVPKLVAAGFEVFGEQDLASVRVNRSEPRLEFIVSSGIDWLDLNAVVTFGDQQVSLVDLGSAIRKRERYVKLADGSIGTILPEWIARYRHLFSFGEITDDGLRLSNRHAIVVEEALEHADAAQVDKEFEARRERLRGFSHISEHPLPAALKAELRPYQKAGVDWLRFLHEYEFGGCLADDMGVGKTVQALAFLLSLKESGEQKSANLIVLPRSLIFNWEREAARFTPSLRLLVHAENKRSKDITHLDQYDLVLTTYGVMLRDIDVLRKYRFHYVVLDEAQTIKNPLSQTGRAARMLQADHRLVLTGTPVENSTIDLWSQFEFLNPGLLGSLEYFRDEFSSAIEKNQDDTSANLLRRMVFPFILRRTKDQVAADLPPRTEKILLAEMEPAQEKLYVATRNRYRDELLGLISKEGMNNARMKILEALLRLRQISNHPKLMDADSTAESGKFELLLETLDTVRAEGHKALVFSQFVRMLSILRDRLDAAGVPYQYLDGKTKDRQARVDTFQSDSSIPLFLISLKAGGVGLNLTAADYVIHIDPWWNPAVERQATDRTHRIGQDKPVFVYKLITRGTVEEKILELQERKRRLVDRLVAGEETFLKSLTRDDVAVLFS